MKKKKQTTCFGKFSYIEHDCSSCSVKNSCRREKDKKKR